MRTHIFVFFVLLLPACGGAPQSASEEKYISRQEWERMPPDEKYDPYVLQRVQGVDPKDMIQPKHWPRK